MKVLDATLLTDGSSDRVLKPIAEFLLDIHSPGPYALQHAESIPSGTLEKRLQAAMVLYPCDLLLVHRDAERQSVAAREAEIAAAVAAWARGGSTTPHVCVIPVRMTEAWLLLDEAAIRRAAGNPAGRAALDLPAADREESIDAKETLVSALERACELGARRLRAFDAGRARLRVAGCVEDLGVLRRLPSFRHFEAQLQDLFRRQQVGAA